MSNARPVVGQLRVSLGQGVEVKVTPAKRRPSPEQNYEPNKTQRPPVAEPLSATFVVHYTVRKDAKRGPRNLLAQFADKRVEWPQAIVIAGD